MGRFQVVTLEGYTGPGKAAQFFVYVEDTEALSRRIVWRKKIGAYGTRRLADERRARVVAAGMAERDRLEAEYGVAA